MKLEAPYGTVYDCPKCGRSGYYKPPYNTLDECMSCRWEREHPGIVGPDTPSALIRTTPGRTTMKIRELIDAVDDSDLQIGDEVSA